jgi:hypothetical protein
MPFRATASQKRLEEAGFEPKMAYAQAAAMEEFVVSELVTTDQFNARLDALELKLDAKLAALRAELKAELAGLETKLIRWMVGSVGGASLAMILTFLRLMR